MADFERIISTSLTSSSLRLMPTSACIRILGSDPMMASEVHQELLRDKDEGCLGIELCEQ